MLLQKKLLKNFAIKKILIANRGEIAARIAKTARNMGIPTVGIYSWNDRSSSHIHCTDEAHLIGKNAEDSSYTNSDEIIRLAAKSGADAIHPGYGYLSENADFACAVETKSLAFIGPPSRVIRLMGDKLACNKYLMEQGVPLLPGSYCKEQSISSLKREAEHIGFPLLIKPSLGGGGKGITLCYSRSNLISNLKKAQRESWSIYGSRSLILEKFVERLQHVEVQIVRDVYGKTLHLSHRDCTIQRRFQKIIEEAPASISRSMETAMLKVAVAIAQSVDYVGVGTVEFIVDCVEKKFYFMEMNTRLQVEHGVTESIIEINGKPLDLVQLQISIAMGEHLPVSQKQVAVTGHSIEARLYAESPSRDFLPQSGRVLHLATSALCGDKVRIDSVIKKGDTIYSDFDPMIAKIIVKSDTRVSAIDLLQNSIKGYSIVGVETNRSFLMACLTNKSFRVGEFTSRFVDEHLTTLLKPKSVFLKHSALAALILSTCPNQSQNPSLYNRLMNFRPNSFYSQVFHYFSPALQKHMACHVEKIPSPFNRNFDELVTMHSYRIAVDVDNHALNTTLDVCVLKHVPMAPDDTTADFFLWKYDVIVDHTERIICDAFLYTEASTDVASLLFPDGSIVTLRDTDQSRATDEPLNETHGDGKVRAPISGRIARLCVSNGAFVQKGDLVLHLHAMKMEHEVRAKMSGKISYFMKEGDVATFNEVVATISPPEKM